jgi:hypothetical protein
MRNEGGLNVWAFAIAHRKPVSECGRSKSSPEAKVFLLSKHKHPRIEVLGVVGSDEFAHAGV